MTRRGQMPHGGETVIDPVQTLDKLLAWARQVGNPQLVALYELRLRELGIEPVPSIEEITA
jgi:hypothetical protein